MTSSNRPAIFLDRDGVINRALVRGGKPYPPSSLAELELTPGALEALERLRANGYVLVVVTNQPDLARGSQRVEVLQEIHSYLAQALPLDAFYVCPHDDADGCDCRKPSPGLLLRAASEMHLDLNASYMIGDRWRDVAAANRAGCRSVFIDYDYQEPKPADPGHVVRSLPEAVSWILTETHNGRGNGFGS